jgi:hypothetical protein
MAAALPGMAPLEAMPTERAFDQVHFVARQHALTACDGAYLELSLRQALPLATLDAWWPRIHVHNLFHVLDRHRRSRRRLAPLLTRHARPAKQTT